jgi:CheY-like chemotaxis protein
MPLTGLTILEVDDYEPHIYVMSRILENAGCKVLQARTGSEALILAAQLPHAIVLDVNLPDLDGFEVCRLLTRDPATANIPIVIVTATYRDDNVQAMAHDAGAKAILFYPVEPEHLVAVLRAQVTKANL